MLLYIPILLPILLPVNFEVIRQLVGIFRSTDPAVIEQGGGRDPPQKPGQATLFQVRGGRLVVT